MQYPVTLFCLKEKEDNFNQKLISQQLSTCKSGLSSFQSLDCSQPLKKLSDFSLSESHPIYDCEILLDLHPLDLIYLYNFRLFLFCQKASSKEKINLTSILSYPNLNFSIQLISQPFKLVSTPLTHILTKKNTTNGRNSSGNSFITTSNSSTGRNKNSNIKFGFLTMDQNHRICPLMASDPIALQVPLIGVWISGVMYPKAGFTGEKFDENYLIWGILAEFVKNQGLVEKYVYDLKKNNFLLACFSNEESPKFYEVELQKDPEWGLLRVKECLEVDNDYLDMGFNTGEEILGLDEVFNKNDDIKERINQDNSFIQRKTIGKLKIDDLNEGIRNRTPQSMPLPREMPKKQELITYLSPRMPSSNNNTFNIESNPISINMK